MPPLTIHYCKTIMRYCQTIIFLLLVLRGFLTYRFKIEVLIDYSSTIAIVEFLRRYTLNLIARLCLAASLAAHQGSLRHGSIVSFLESGESACCDSSHFFSHNKRAKTANRLTYQMQNCKS